MENNFKKIKAILDPPAPHMVGDGFRVHNFFPAIDIIGVQGMSPFFLLDYNSKVIIPPSEKPKGVGVHPHRGIETVSIAYQGKVAHHDSAGNSGVIEKGDVQWMTAGGGVLHKEYHEKEFSKKGGEFQMVQLWVNLPAAVKMTPAKYQAIENRNMGKYFIEGGGHFDIIAGEYKGVKGPASTFSPVSLFNAELPEGLTTDMTFEASDNTGILIIEGEVLINGSDKAKESCFVYFKNEGEVITVKALSNTKMLILSGKPLNEPIAPYGPFVMNTQKEIQEAYDDYYNGKFGYLED
jgi:redox-sensitive bicupin YhaK (pirin superfamily)